MASKRDWKRRRLREREREREKEREIPLWRYFGSDFVVIGGDLFYRHLPFAWRLLYSLNFTCSWVECKSESWSLPRLVPVLDVVVVRHSPVRWFFTLTQFLSLCHKYFFFLLHHHHHHLRLSHFMTLHHSSLFLWLFTFSTCDFLQLTPVYC